MSIYGHRLSSYNESRTICLETFELVTINESNYSSHQEYIKEVALIDTIENKINELKNKDKSKITESDIKDLTAEIERVQDKKVQYRLLTALITILIGIVSEIVYFATLNIPAVIISICSSIVSIINSNLAASIMDKEIDNIINSLNKIIDKYTNFITQYKENPNADSKKNIDTCNKVISICKKEKEYIEKNKNTISNRNRLKTR